TRFSRDWSSDVCSSDLVRLYFPLFLANGITGIRDTWGSREVAAEVAAEVSAGVLAGPVRLVVAGNLVDGPARIWPNSQVAITPEIGRAACRGRGRVSSE